MHAAPRTMVHQLHLQAERLADRPALWTKRQGTWLPTSWRQYATRVKDLALAFISLGLEPKQAVGIIGANREEWLVSALAATACQAVPVGLYTTSSPEQLQYILSHCEARILVVENVGFLERVLAVRERLPALEHIIVMDAPQPLPEGVLRYDAELLRGHGLPEGPYFERLEAARPDDLATLIYTSGTTGHPKGVMLTHRNVCWTALALVDATGLGDDEVMLSYLPLSHIAEQACSIYGPLMRGIQVSFAESFDALGENLREVRPTVFFAVPRVWEKFKVKAEAGFAKQPPARQRTLAWARDVAARWHALTLEHRQPTLRLTAQYALAQQLVFRPLKARLGLDRCRFFATSAAPIARDVLDFFASIDVVLREVYGQSEVTGPTSVSTLEHTRLGALGRPLAGVAVRIADDGEILVKGENVCAGYFKNPEATAELIQEGWLHSGDVGELDADGYLRITGRKKEIIVTSGGKKTPPATLEGLLKSIEPIGQALVVGDRRPYLVALLTLDPEKLEAFRARNPGLVPAPQDTAFHAWLEAQIAERVNTKVSRFETIKRFTVLPHDFTIEGGELTSTLKVRRSVCEAKYAKEIEALYAGAETHAA
ncbi:MAG: long-chain fatty acid--CoA ligase [Myxococcaceae bacterium]|nr:long-chain fatty acid--CoA ligase [Myxococcaceae bacterium]